MGSLGGAEVVVFLRVGPPKWLRLVIRLASDFRRSNFSGLGSFGKNRNFGVAPSSPRTPRREDLLRGAETAIKEAVIISDSMVPRGMLDTMVSKMHLLDIKGRKKLPYGVNEKGFIYLLALEIGNSRGLIDAKLSKILCWQRVCSGGGAVPSAFAM